mmetsp:Transcript_109020/g.351870  ORF Transcript_109020/g.351870 Transcript_109020/m.351870 type:complete len:203 (+) Transcript_109020:563-1171(+)
MRLFRQVQHVAREQRLALDAEEVLVVLEHAVEPRQQLLRAMVRVHEHRDAVGRRHRPGVGGARDGAQHRRLLLLVGEALAGEEARTALRELDDDGAVELPAGLQDGVHGARRGAIHRGHGEALGLGEAQKRPCEVASEHSGLHAWDVPKAVQILDGWVEDLLVLVALDAVLVAEPRRLGSTDHGGGAIVASAACPQGPQHHA